MSVTVPGKIFVIENRWDDVKDIIESFWKAGEGIVYSRDIPEEDKCPSNVRLVILDLLLSEDGGEIEDTDYQQAALAISRIEKKTGFFLVAPWSLHITSDNKKEVIENLKKAYREHTQKDLPERILKAFGKKEINQKQMMNEIKEWISRNPEAGLVFEWEKTIEDGRDNTTSAIVRTGGIKTIVKATEKEVGGNAVPREIFTLFNRLLLRHSLMLMKKGTFTSIVKQILKKKGLAETNILDWYPKIHYLNAYFEPEVKEPLWTGDILKTNIKQSSEKEYVLVITPACDFANKKVEQITVIFGIKIETIPDYTLEVEDIPLLVKKIGMTKEQKYKTRKEIINAITLKNNLPARFHVLHFLRHPSDLSNYFHLMLDFSTVGSRRAEKYADRNIKVPGGWERICRLDSPYIEEIVQKYTSFSARIGTPDIPSEALKEEGKRLKSEH